MVDMKNALQWLATDGYRQTVMPQSLPTIQVTGARLLLPSRYAMALSLLVHEYLQAILDAAPDQPTDEILVALQQIGRDLLVHIECDADRGEKRATVNHAIIHLALQLLPGKLEESFEDGRYRVRFRARCPPARRCWHVGITPGFIQEDRSRVISDSYS